MGLGDAAHSLPVPKPAAGTTSPTGGLSLSERHPEPPARAPEPPRGPESPALRKLLDERAATAVVGGRRRLAGGQAAPRCSARAERAPAGPGSRRQLTAAPARCLHPHPSASDSYCLPPSQARTRSHPHIRRPHPPAGHPATNGQHTLRASAMEGAQPTPAGPGSATQTTPPAPCSWGRSAHEVLLGAEWAVRRSREDGCPALAQRRQGAGKGVPPHGP